jgi:hypothetical protein
MGRSLMQRRHSCERTQLMWLRSGGAMTLRMIAFMRRNAPTPLSRPFPLGLVPPQMGAHLRRWDTALPLVILRNFTNALSLGVRKGENSLKAPSTMPLEWGGWLVTWGNMLTQLGAAPRSVSS